MGAERNSGHLCPQLFKLLVVLLSSTLARAAIRQQVVNITGCSESGLNFTLNEMLNINSLYTFLAACKDNDGTCVDHKSALPLGIEPTVGSPFQISVGPSCTLRELSPNGRGLCTLLISTSNVFNDYTGIVFSDACALYLPMQTATITSTFTVYQNTCTPDSRSLDHRAYVRSVVVPVAVTVVAVLLITMAFILAIVSSLMCSRKIRSRRMLAVKMDMLNVHMSPPSIRLSSIGGDSITQYDSIFFDEEEFASRTELSGIVPFNPCHTAECTAVEPPLQSSSGYVSIQYTSQQ